jgi:hypothetical protein
MLEGDRNSLLIRELRRSQWQRTRSKVLDLSMPLHTPQGHPIAYKMQKSRGMMLIKRIFQFRNTVVK